MYHVYHAFLRLAFKQGARGGKSQHAWYYHSFQYGYYITLIACGLRFHSCSYHDGLDERLYMSYQNVRCEEPYCPLCAESAINSIPAAQGTRSHHHLKYRHRFPPYRRLFPGTIENDLAPTVISVPFFQFKATLSNGCSSI